MPGLTFGAELPDNVDKISGISEAQLGLISDLRDLFRERIALERDYALKFQALAKKASDKKSKRMPKLVLGDEPTQVWTEETVKLSTFDVAYSKLVSSLENSAGDHVILADSLFSQVTDELEKLKRRSEEVGRKEKQFYEKLISDKERAASERAKAKAKYDEECLEIESYRHKQDRAVGDKHADRAAKQLEQQKIDMLNCKNTYLIAIAVANKAKNKFYEQDLPLLENQLQSLQADITTSITDLLQHSQSLCETHLDSLRSRVASVQTALSQVDASKDQELFLEYNRAPIAFQIPEDSVFEPCEGFYDAPDINTESAPKIFLQNKLRRCRAKLQELEPLIQEKQEEANKLESLIAAYSQDRSLGNLDEVKEHLLDNQHQHAYLCTSRIMLNAEIDVISGALGDDEGEQRPHTFKSSPFSIPTQCGYCKSSIWGLSKQGKTCKLCHLSVHAKCELKVPADCSGATEVKRHTHKSNSITSIPPQTRTSAEVEVSTPSSFGRPYAMTHEEQFPLMTVLFDFEASSPFELSVNGGDKVHLLEVDDGSGWVKISDSQGGKGLIPASYVKLKDEGDDDGEGSIVDSSVPSQGLGGYVRALYTYDAQSPEEISLKEGELLELSTGPNGGQNYAEGWWEGIDSSGKKGIFPSNYVEAI